MDGLRVILLVIAIIIIVYNLAISLGNIFKITVYCFYTNSLGEYWNHFFKNCVSGRAIISSLFSFFLALVIFLIITPIIIIKKLFFKERNSEIIENGQILIYKDYQVENKKFYTNAESLNLGSFDYEATGKLRVDAVLFIGDLSQRCEKEGKEVETKVLHKITGKDNFEIIIPVFIKINNEEFPTYFLYDETHKRQFNTIKNTLYTLGYKNCIYFSVLPM